MKNRGTVIKTKKKEEIFGPKRADEVTIVYEKPVSAGAKKAYYQLWKFAMDLTPEEIEVLVAKRKNDLKYEKKTDRIEDLRTEIKILEDMYMINKRKVMK